MLVLSRKQNQAFQIGDEITVRVIEIRGDRVRLGIEAPRTTPIVRDDVIKSEPEAVECVLPERVN